MGKPQHGIPKDFNAGVTKKELKGRNQGTTNQEVAVKPLEDQLLSKTPKV